MEMAEFISKELRLILLIPISGTLFRISYYLPATADIGMAPVPVIFLYAF
jgi:hypothetical protein